LSLLIDGVLLKRLHFIGILGSGMSSLAQYCRWLGVKVGGSDRALDSPESEYVRNGLRDLGCEMHPQDGSGVGKGLEGVVVSTAVENTNPDVVAARRLGIPVYHRSDILAAIANSAHTIAVAGTSGKSTVTALIFHLLRESGVDASFICGAESRELKSEGLVGNAYHGTSDILVIEADESDGSLVKYAPKIGVILNISKDHKPVPELLKLFEEFASNSSYLLVNAEYKELGALPGARTFGFGGKGDFSAKPADGNPSSAGIFYGGNEYRVPYPGGYMAQNLLVAVLVARQFVTDPIRIQTAAQAYSGIARRFDIAYTAGGVPVIDDFAHNPDKIRAALGAARTLGDRIVAVFQPHGYGPTRFMFDELVSTFSEALKTGDTLYLLPIYYVGGSVMKDVSSQELADAVSANGVQAVALTDRTEVAVAVAEKADKGCVVVSMGARDPSLSSFAADLVKRIQNRGL
jgi:UDP-N-acetylmuramate--alanine ligase